MTLHIPEATAAALSILRTGEPFQWYVVTLLALSLFAVSALGILIANAWDQRQNQVVRSGITALIQVPGQPGARAFRIPPNPMLHHQRSRRR